MVCALVDDLWRVVNPFDTLAALLQRAGRRLPREASAGAGGSDLWRAVLLALVALVTIAGAALVVLLPSPFPASPKGPRPRPGPARAARNVADSAFAVTHRRENA